MNHRTHSLTALLLALALCLSLLTGCGAHRTRKLWI